MHRTAARRVSRAALAFAILANLGACNDDPAAATPACDPTLRPVIFAHGFLAASDTWSLQVARFEANGMCPDHLAVFDWNTLAADGAEAQLDQAIDRLRTATGAATVDLVGHSAGGGLGYRYLADPAHAAKVAHYAHLASSEQTSLPGPSDAPIPTVAVRSEGDLIAKAKDIPGATNLVLTSADHYEVATSAETFGALWQHFEGAAPKTSEPAPTPRGAHPTLAGKALTLGENTPVAGWTVDVFALVPATGARVAAAPEATFTVAADGAWGPFEATTGTRYELFLHGPGAEDRPIHYYLEAVTRTDRLVVLRALPAADSLVGTLLSQLPFDDRHVVLIAFSASKAVINGRDTLAVDDRALATPELASAARTAIAFFLFDEHVDQTSGAEAGTFGGLLTVFLTAVDDYLAADPALGPLTLTLGSAADPNATRTLTVPRWPSATAGATVVIFR